MRFVDLVTSCDLDAMRCVFGGVGGSWVDWIEVLNLELH